MLNRRLVEGLAEGGLRHGGDGRDGQIVTVAVDCTPIYDSTNGIITAVAKCNVGAICQ
jgi:hypothetical protein